MLTAFGIILIVFGFLAIGVPLVTGVATGLLVGGLILVCGVTELSSAFRAGSWGGGILAIASFFPTLPRSSALQDAKSPTRLGFGMSNTLQVWSATNGVALTG